MKLLRLRSVGLKLTLLSLMHLVTDGLCAYLAFSKLYPDNPKMAALLFFGYNILAFVTQSPFGLLIDKYNKPKIFLGLSVVFMILGYAFSNVWFISVLFIGISNSVFHVAGGKYVTDKSGNDISHLGIFVSTGAVGLMLGQRCFSFALMPYIFFAALIISGLIIIFSEDSDTLSYTEFYEGGGSEYALLAVVAVVCIRSFVGKVVTPDFALNLPLFALVALATALGKAAGGIASKIFGVKITTYVSMIVAAVCLTLGCANEFIFIIGVFAFNFSMPITLHYANILLKGREGFAFGTLAAALTPGYFIASMFTYSTELRVCTALLCIVSMLVIIIVSKRINKNANSLTVNHNN